jgi:hypothetical protein
MANDCTSIEQAGGSTYLAKQLPNQRYIKVVTIVTVSIDRNAAVVSRFPKLSVHSELTVAIQSAV